MPLTNEPYPTSTFDGSRRARGREANGIAPGRCAGPPRICQAPPLDTCPAACCKVMWGGNTSYSMAGSFANVVWSPLAQAFTNGNISWFRLHVPPLQRRGFPRLRMHAPSPSQPIYLVALFATLFCPHLTETPLSALWIGLFHLADCIVTPAPPLSASKFSRTTWSNSRRLETSKTLTLPLVCHSTGNQKFSSHRMLTIFFGCAGGRFG